MGAVCAGGVAPRKELVGPGGAEAADVLRRRRRVRAHGGEALPRADGPRPQRLVPRRTHHTLPAPHRLPARRPRRGQLLGRAVASLGGRRCALGCGVQGPGSSTNGERPRPLRALNDGGAPGPGFSPNASAPALDLLRCRLPGPWTLYTAQGAVGGLRRTPPRPGTGPGPGPCTRRRGFAHAGFEGVVGGVRTAVRRGSAMA
jgi:hypothetical protein